MLTVELDGEGITQAEEGLKSAVRRIRTAKRIVVVCGMSLSCITARRGSLLMMVQVLASRPLLGSRISDLQKDCLGREKEKSGTCSMSGPYQ